MIGNEIFQSNDKWVKYYRDKYGLNLFAYYNEDGECKYRIQRVESKDFKIKGWWGSDYYGDADVAISHGISECMRIISSEEYAT